MIINALFLFYYFLLNSTCFVLTMSRCIDRDLSFQLLPKCLLPCFLIITVMDSYSSETNEEIEEVTTIYGKEQCVINGCAKIFCIRIIDDIDGPKQTLRLQVTLPSKYSGTATYLSVECTLAERAECAPFSNSLEEKLPFLVQ